VFGAVANSIYGGSSGGNADPATVISASGAVFLAALVAGLLTVAAVLSMPAVKAEDSDSSDAEPVPTQADGSSS
jgi:hypothetical protein